ncbi:twin-arginine translocase subunit TatC [Halarchaeum nitratireducens]|uniref:Sec-independent protein translocase protein TatC n=1 Tax=Halarchaeum nitratireducens TaxID=489913 RepID=A0A830GA40_9EURY|nr:twin-arginine translocase subunit TatC [Halarchaeum nitratireducens]GGN11597.1 protein export [Halarchaeum nitratireducens]
MGDAPDGPSDDGDDADGEDVARAEAVDAGSTEPDATDLSEGDSTASHGATTDGDATSADGASEGDSTDGAGGSADSADGAADGGYADPPDSVPETGDPSVPDEGPTVADEGPPIEEHDGAETPPAEEEGGVLGGAPETDQEQPIAVHVEEMVRRLGIVVLVAGVVSALCFPWGDTLITFIWDGVLPASSTAQPHVYAPLELIVTQFKVASIAGVVVALPVIVYETYAFMRPGLYPHERRYYLAAIPTSLVLAVVGIVFAYFVVVPSVMSYFLYYSTSVANAALALGSTFNLILVLMAYLAIVFQIPLFVMLAIMMGLTTRRWLAERRLLFWGAFAGVAFLATPDPTGVAPVVVAATMIVLFEGTLGLLRWTGN